MRDIYEKPVWNEAEQIYEIWLNGRAVIRFEPSDIASARAAAKEFNDGIPDDDNNQCSKQPNLAQAQ